ncbi:MAG: FAD-binding protein [Chitinophagaceae bacterium]|nr:FAD-binding protein [Chitinophagaceae bacterium]
MITEFRKTWKNTVSTFQADPIRYVYPESLEEIVAAVKDAESDRLPIRPVGSGHSFNDIACGNGVMIDIKKLNRILEKGDKSFVQPKNGNTFLEIEAGIIIQQLYAELEKRKLAIVNMGGVYHQTLAGAIATGTHGTGLGLPAVSGAVRSMVLVASNGRKFRIEPEGGISDPFKQHQMEPEITLVQNTTDFNAALVHLGCFGIIYSYVVEVLPEYFLRESKRLETWETVKDILKKGDIFRETRSFMILLNPYCYNERYWCIMIKHRISPNLYNWFGAKKRNLITRLGNHSFIFYYARWRLNRKPEITPKFLHNALKSQQDIVYIDKAQRVLYQAAEKIKKHAYDTEAAFEYSYAKFEDLIEKIMARLETIRKEGNIYLQSPMGIRFVKKSNALLTPESDRFVFYIDAPVLKGSVGTEGLLDEMQELFIREGGIFHWGKINNRLTSHLHTIREHYPKLDDWLRVMKKYNAENLFNNSFTDRLQLTETLP